jgi:hypothetical protein
VPAICALLDRVVHPGAFFYHRPLYNDETWVPDRLEYGVLVDDREWWVEQFRNKSEED